MISEDKLIDCLFCKIVNNEVTSYKIYEDNDYLAFLTPYPNTPGFSVVIPKSHHESYGFNVEEEVLLELIKTAKKVALLIDKGLKTKRTGLIMEGYGINHLHIKLFPMHGIEDGPWRPILSEDKTFYETYSGMIASNDGPEMSKEELLKISEKIKLAQSNL